MNKYLLEIGVEELPSRFVELAINEYKNKAIKLLDENKITYETMKVYATPRRLSLIVEGIASKQEDLSLEVKGPAKKISFDEDNNPTKPLKGFMKSQNIDIDSIVIKEIKGTEYVFAHIEKKGDSTENILRENMSGLIKSINFPKNMKWGGKNIKFARPIRWVVSLLNDKVVEFEFEGIPVSNVTRGHRFLGSSNIVVDHVDNYENLLKENYVILDQDKRRETIKYGSTKLAKSLGGELEEDEDLLTELTYIVEYPNPIVGEIQKKYLELPKEVITTPMKGHLRFIPVLDSKGNLLPYFITIRNGNDDYKDIVVEGNEKVLQARLEDARFFYEEDTSKPLEAYVDSLRGIVFQDKLGTIYDKSIRVSKLSNKIGESLEVAEETLDSLERSAILSKADLVTKTVQEFTELQGIMGSIYAKKSDEKDIVAQAICEQYLPRFAGDDLPKSTIGSILSISDKVDTICGLFAIGLIPTGSQDPFALRRSTIGVINILEHNKWDLYIEDIIEFSLFYYTDQMSLAFDYDKTKDNILEFFKSRIKNMLQEKGIRYDLIDSIIDSNLSITDLFQKSSELNSYFKSSDRINLIESLNRVHNLASKNTENANFKEELLIEDEEKDLYLAQMEVLEIVNDLLDKKEYKQAIIHLEDLINPINNYFNNIMVLVDDVDLRNNRLSMISKIDSVVNKIFNIEKIVTE